MSIGCVGLGKPGGGGVSQSGGANFEGEEIGGIGHLTPKRDKNHENMKG